MFTHPYIEIKILNKALELRAEDFKSKAGKDSDIKSALLFDVGMCKQEVDELKEKYYTVCYDFDRTKKQLEEAISKLQSLNFSKVEFTELLVEFHSF